MRSILLFLALASVLCGGSVLMLWRLDRDRLRQRAKQGFCGLMGGHDRLPFFEKDSITLRCVSCEHSTPGWLLNEKPPRRRVA